MPPWADLSLRAWADMEQCLDFVVLTGRKLKSPPHQLSEKTNFVRKVLVPVISPTHATSVLRLIDEIDELAPTRHDYVHGAVIGHDIVRSKLAVSLARMLQAIRIAAASASGKIDCSSISS